MNLPTIVDRTTRMTERFTLAEETTLHDAYGRAFRTSALIILTTSTDVTVCGVGITGRQRHAQAQVLDPDEADGVLAALDRQRGVRRLTNRPD